MVRGNWQKRVESAQARREEQKARKARKGDRETYRTMATGLVSFLGDRHMVSEVAGDGGGPLTMHVWVDSPPGGKGAKSAKPAAAAAERGVADDDFDSDEDGKSKRQKSKRQNRKKQQGSAKKAHPRQGLKHSHHAEQDDADAGGDDDTMLCGNHFFLNKCAGAASSGKGKSRGKGASVCKLHHSRDPTLAFVLKKDRGAEASLAASAKAASSSDDQSIDMFWYLNMSPVKNCQEDSEVSSLNEALQSILSRKNLGAATVVYVVLGKTLIYDRNRGGLLESEIGQDSDDEAVLEEPEIKPEIRRRSRGESFLFLSDTENKDVGAGGRILVQFPGSVLEVILLYLPDLYTGNLPLVCSAWNAEIGRTSPNLWRQLLLRGGLPIPATSGTLAEEDDTYNTYNTPSSMDGASRIPRDIFRNAFIGHYTAKRDLHSIRDLLLGSLSQHVQPQLETSAPNNACSINYSSNPRSPRASSGLTSSIKVWSEGKVLVAYSGDCTLRLFEAVNTGGSLTCRQTVCVTMSPEPNSKRGQWELTGMNLDEQYVCCMCRPGVTGNTKSKDPPVQRSPCMLLTRREDILVTSGGQSEELDDKDIVSIDLRERLIDYLVSDGWARLSNAGGSELELDFIDYIENEDHSYLRLETNQDIVACGGGRFLFSVIFSFMDDQSEDEIEEVLAHRIFLYSAKDRKFIWDANIAQFQDQAHLIHRPHIPRPRIFGGPNIASSVPSKGFPAILTFPETSKLVKVNVFKDGRVNYQDMSIQSTLAEEVRSWRDFADDELERRTQESSFLWRPAALTSSTVVVVHNIRYRHGNATKNRAILTFSHIIGEGNRTNADGVPSVLTLNGECTIHDVQPLRLSDHVVLFCQTYASQPAPLNQQDAANNGDEVDEDEITGDWFGITNESNHAGQTVTDEGAFFLVLIHVPSQKEIGRCRIMDSFTSGDEPPLFTEINIATSDDTIAIEVDGEGLVSRGLVMGGLGVRQVLEVDPSAAKHADDSNQKAKKKKKRQATRASGRNKDGFARGMSGRG